MRSEEEEKILKGILFDPSVPELVAKKRKAHDLNLDFNRLYEGETEKRKAILRELLGSLGVNTFIQGPITFHYGYHTYIGKNTFINFNLTVQDDGEVYIGDDCALGPNVTIVTPVHPMLAEERCAIRALDGTVKKLCYAKPVRIGDKCWIGANTVVCPGVTVGDNCVIGAGSVIVKDIPANSFAAGNPCRVIRVLTEKDSMVNLPHILADNEVI